MKLAATVALVATLSSACSARDEGRAEVVLTLSHPSPLVLREVLVARFREANDTQRLTLTSARAVPGDDALTLTLALTLPTACDDAALSRVATTAEDLATAAATLAIHAADRDGAKRLADLLRGQLARDVVVPFERPGLVVMALSDSERALLRRFEAAEPALLVVTDPRIPQEHWVIVRTPHLTSADLVATSLSIRERLSVDLTFDRDAAARLARLTEQVGRHPLPILLDGALALTPTLASRVSEGRLRLDLPATELGLGSRLAATTLTVRPSVVGRSARCLLSAPPGP